MIIPETKRVSSKNFEFTVDSKKNKYESVLVSRYPEEGDGMFANMMYFGLLGTAVQSQLREIKQSDIGAGAVKYT